MDLRIGLLLLLLLAYASGTCSHTSASGGPVPIPLHHHQQHHHHHQQQQPSNHLRRQQRPQRELSEFLVPPPMPLNFRGPRGPPPSSQPRIPPTSSQPRIPPTSPRVPSHRTGRYQGGAPGYLSNLMNWLNPFGEDSKANPQPAASQQRPQIAQYAPQMPYTGLSKQYTEPIAQATNHLQSSSHSSGGQNGISAWMNGKPCNPCNQVPWVPMFPDNYPSQYAPNAGQNTYLPPVSQEVKDYTSPHQTQQNFQNPYIGVMPPLVNAQPFHQSPPSQNHQLSSSIIVGTPSVNSFDHHHQSSSFSNQPPSNFDHHQSSNFGGHPSVNFNSHQGSNFDNQPNFDHHQSNFDQQGSIEFDHPPEGHDSQNFDEHPPSDYSSSSSYEQHHQSSQIIGVVKEPPEHPNQINREPDHAESRPVYIDTSTSRSTLTPRPPDTKTFHFQRSPIIDLSVAGESTTVRPVYRPELKRSTTTTTPKPPSTISSVSVIDYIVDESAFASSEEKETRLRATTTSTTTQRSTTTRRTTTTTEPLDQKSQESLIETLVQSYEIFKKDEQDRRPGGPSGERIKPVETEESSASKEVVMPSKTDSGEQNKKIIQIIIPYTSQYTASPFHPTKSGVSNGHARGGEPTEEPELEDNVVIEESRRVSVTRKPPVDPLRNNRTSSEEDAEAEEEARLSNTIDVHRLQKNIDNWTIQEYSKTSTSNSNKRNSTYPRWLSSKQIPDEYLLTATDSDESSEYYDFTNETAKLHHRGIINKTQVTTSTTPEPTTKVYIINATYPKKPKKVVDPTKAYNATRTSSSGERVYVVTPIPVNSLEDNRSGEKRKRRPKQRDTVSFEQAYQVLPQAVNNLAVVSSVPNSAAPVLWGIMEHEELSGTVEQPRWRSESDLVNEADDLPEPVSTPILYAGHSKVSRAR